MAAMNGIRPVFPEPAFATQSDKYPYRVNGIEYFKYVVSEIPESKV